MKGKEVQVSQCSLLAEVKCSLYHLWQFSARLFHCSTFTHTSVCAQFTAPCAHFNNHVQDSHPCTLCLNAMIRFLVLYKDTGVFSLDIFSEHKCEFAVLIGVIRCKIHATWIISWCWFIRGSADTMIMSESQGIGCGNRNKYDKYASVHGPDSLLKKKKNSFVWFKSFFLFFWETVRICTKEHHETVSCTTYKSQVAPVLVCYSYSFLVKSFPLALFTSVTLKC